MSVTSFTLGEGLAFFFGALLARFVDIQPKQTISLAYCMILCTVSLFFIDWVAGGRGISIIPPTFIIFSFFGGFILPLTYAMFGKEADAHEQGMLFGIIESCQMFTEWGGSTALNTFSQLRSPQNLMIGVICCSVFSVLLTISMLRDDWSRSSLRKR